MFQRVKAWRVFVFSLTITTSCSIDSKDQNKTPDRLQSSIQKNCEPWAEYQSGEYLLTNNIWGFTGDDPYKQCIAISHTESGQPLYSWDWQWQGQQGNVLAYPSILYGHKPWNETSTTSKLPIRLDHLKRLKVAYYVKQTASGSHNVLLESWISSTKKPTPSTRVAELAIHLSQQNWPGMPGKLIRSVVIGGEPYDFYIEPQMTVPRDDSQWVYLGFVYTGQKPTVGSVDIAKFISYLLNNGYLATKTYLSSVELGSELISGEGKTQVEAFSVRF
ncbi:MAG: hypothetical protein V3U78_07165 [Thiotrichaceae bacterium]